jgi:hypothetical protein
MTLFTQGLFDILAKQNLFGNFKVPYLEYADKLSKSIKFSHIKYY